MADNWVSANRVQRNDQGELRALIGDEWVPVARAQKNDDGEFRVLLPGEAPAAKEAPTEGKKESSILTDIAAGATSLGAKVLDLPARVLNAPWLRSELGTLQDRADKSSLAYMGGSVLDPLAAATGSGMFGAAQRIVPKAGMIGQGMLGGAAAGGLVGGAQSESLEGAGIGAGVGAALPLGFATVRGAYNLAAPTFSKAAAERGAAREVSNMAGADAKKLADLLAQGEAAKFSPLETMAQVAQPLENTRIPALQKVWQEKYGSVAAARNRASQQALEDARIAVLGARMAPQRQGALEAANRTTAAFDVAERKGAEYADEAAQQVANVRRLEGLKSYVEQNPQSIDALQQRIPQAAGQPRVGGTLSRATELGDVVTGVVEPAAEQAAKDSLVAGASARLADNIVGSMAARGLEPLSAGKFIAAVNQVRSTPENVTNDALRLVSQKVINAVNRAAEANNGILDARSLDTIRRTTISDYINSASKGNPAQAKQLASSEMTRSIKKMVDEAIEKAGGRGYSDYMREYATLREKIETPLRRLGESDELAAKGMREVLEILNEEKLPSAGVLERAVPITQAVARGLKGVGGQQVSRAGAELVLPENTQRLGRLMQSYQNRYPYSQFVTGAAGGMMSGEQ